VTDEFQPLCNPDILALVRNPQLHFWFVLLSKRRVRSDVDFFVWPLDGDLFFSSYTDYLQESSVE
jgi:hypothetical protein